MQRLITAIETDLDSIGSPGNTALDAYIGIANRLFPETSSLTPSERILVITRMTPVVNHTAYVEAIKEAAAAERHAELCAAINANTAAINSRNDAGVVSTGLSATNEPLVNNPDVSAPDCGAKNITTIDQFKHDLVALCLIKDDIEHQEWNAKIGGGVIHDSVCSFLLHKNMHEMLEFLLSHTTWYCGPSVSAQLATAGDLHALKKLWELAKTKQGKYVQMCSDQLVVEAAFSRGQLHILNWLGRDAVLRAVRLDDVFTAVRNTHLDVIQWYFITFPAMAGQQAEMIYEHAEANQMFSIVDWMQSMGIYPTAK